MYTVSLNFHLSCITLLVNFAVTFSDVTTVANLELLRNIRDPHSEHTLYGILNTTKSRMGSRLLRMNILQPPCGIIHKFLHCTEFSTFCLVLSFLCIFLI